MFVCATWAISSPNVICASVGLNEYLSAGIGRRNLPSAGTIGSRHPAENQTQDLPVVQVPGRQLPMVAGAGGLERSTQFGTG
jgi:hypothetical protein